MTRPRNVKPGTVDPTPSGKYRARYFLDGKQKSAGTFEKKSQAWAKLHEIAVDRRRGDFFDESSGDVLLADFARTVLARTKKTTPPGTWRNWEISIRLHILPTLGQKRLNEIRLSHLKVWWSEKSDRKPQRRNAYMTLRMLYREAIEDELVRHSPCNLTDASKDVSKRPKHVTPEQYREIVEAAPQGLQAALWVMLGSHARKGELCGLNRGDVDISTMTVHIERQYTEAGGLHLAPLKTDSSDRIVRLYGTARDALLLHLLMTDGGDDEPLFRGARGGRLHPQVLYQIFKDAAAKAGYPEARPHVSRHTGLTEFAGLTGATVAQLQMRAGQSTPTAAMRYQHASRETDAYLADLAHEKLERAKVG